MTGLRLLSVNVGTPKLIGALHGEPVLSSIGKSPVVQDKVFVRLTHIEGDAQADLTVHGGNDKAVYCYPADHWRWWEGEKSLLCEPATFGENLTVEGADETAIAIGDRFCWGDAILEVSQPRGPCFKFAIHTARADAPALMTISGRCGWYYRVIREGWAPSKNANLVLEHKSAGPSVRDAFFAALDPRASREIGLRVASAESLARSWRVAVARRFHRETS